MTQEIQNNTEQLTQWPYQWELEKGDQRITVIAQDILIPHDKYPEQVHKQIQNAKVLVLDANIDITSKETWCKADQKFKAYFRSSVENNFAKLDEDLNLAIQKNPTNEKLKMFRKELNEIRQFKNIPWFSHIAEDQKEQLIAIFKQHAPTVNVATLNFIEMIILLCCFQPSNIFFPHENLLKQSLIFETLKNYQDKKKIIGTDTNYMKLNRNYIKENVSENQPNSLSPTYHTYSEIWHFPPKTQLKAVIKTLSMVLSEGFSEYLYDLDESKDIDSVPKSLHQISEKDFIEQKEVIRSFINDCLPRAQDENFLSHFNHVTDLVSTFMPSMYYTAQRVQSVPLYELLRAIGYEDDKNKPLKKTVQNALHSHHEISVIADKKSLEGKNGLINHLLNQGFTEAKA